MWIKIFLYVIFFKVYFDKIYVEMQYLYSAKKIKRRKKQKNSLHMSQYEIPSPN